MTRTIQLITDGGRSHPFRLHVSREPLRGGDDYLIRVAIDTAAPLIGGLWIRFYDDPLTGFGVWDEHGAARDLLTVSVRDAMRAAARIGGAR